MGSQAITAGIVGLAIEFLAYWLKFAAEASGNDGAASAPSPAIASPWGPDVMAERLWECVWAVMLEARLPGDYSKPIDLDDVAVRTWECVWAVMLEARLPGDHSTPEPDPEPWKLSEHDIHDWKAGIRHDYARVMAWESNHRLLQRLAQSDWDSWAEAADLSPPLTVAPVGASFAAGGTWHDGSTVRHSHKRKRAAMNGCPSLLSAGLQMFRGKWKPRPLSPGPRALGPGKGGR